MMEATDLATTRRTHLIIRSKEGAHYSIPLAQLGEFAVPEGAIVLQLTPGQYLAIPRERLEEFRMPDADRLQFLLEHRLRRRGRARHRRRMGPLG